MGGGCTELFFARETCPFFCSRERAWALKAFRATPEDAFFATPPFFTLSCPCTIASSNVHERARDLRPKSPRRLLGFNFCRKNTFANFLEQPGSGSGQLGKGLSPSQWVGTPCEDREIGRGRALSSKMTTVDFSMKAIERAQVRESAVVVVHRCSLSLEKLPP